MDLDPFRDPNFYDYYLLSLLLQFDMDNQRHLTSIAHKHWGFQRHKDGSFNIPFMRFSLLFDHGKRKSVSYDV